MVSTGCRFVTFALSDKVLEIRKQQNHNKTIILRELIKVSRLSNAVKQPLPPHYATSLIHVLHCVSDVMHETVSAQHHMDTDHRTRRSSVHHRNKI